MVVCFIRHGPLVPPYDAYAGLTLGEIDGLATRRVDPSTDRSKLHIVRWLARDLTRAKSLVVLCATTRRAEQTASYLVSEVQRSVSVMPTKLLDELDFTPSRLLGDESYRTGGMSLLRRRLFEAVIEGSDGAESVYEIFERMRRLDELLKGKDADYVLCITHGFYMRFLELYFRLGVAEPAAVSLSDVSLRPRQNLRGFAVEV